VIIMNWVECWFRKDSSAIKEKKVIKEKNNNRKRI
jgi:hypothetical protein